MDTFDDINDQSFGDQEQDDLLEVVVNPGREEHGGERMTPSQDQDFQSQDHVVVRPRSTGVQSNIPEPRPQNVETEESTCSICFEPWTNTGDHRLVSIKCGHLFGNSCIVKWILQGSRDEVVKCPECNHPTKKKDIRPIWSKAVVAVDTSEKDEALVRAKKEQERRVRCEQELAHARMALEMLKSETVKLQKRHDRQRSSKRRYRAEVKRLRLSNPEAAIQKIFSYSAFKTLPVAIKESQGTVHYMSYRRREDMLVCSRQVNDAHGIARISMLDYSHNLHNFTPIHSKPIRDVQCFNGDPTANRSMVLTCSMDKSIKTTLADSQRTVLSYGLDSPVWSCCWSTSNPNIFYGSTKSRHSSILTFDLRNTKSSVASFSNPSLLGRSPIHSMVHISPNHHQAREGILCGNLESAFVYNFEEGSALDALSQESLSSFSQGSGPLEKGSLLRKPNGSCFSVSFDPVSHQWMASFKFLGNSTQHDRGILVQDLDHGHLSLKSEHCVTGGAAVSCMSRSSIYSWADGSVHMAVGSEGLAYVWRDHDKAGHDPPEIQTAGPSSQGRSSRGMARQEKSKELHRSALQLQERASAQLNQRDWIKDVKAVAVGQEEYLATLSDRELVLYRWSEDYGYGRVSSGREGAGEDSESEGEDLDGGVDVGVVGEGDQSMSGIASGAGASSSSSVVIVDN